METFRTIVSTGVSKDTIALNHRILTLGSCFSDVIGSKLKENKFSTAVNPFGAIYNPVSIHKLLSYAIFNEQIASHTFLQQGDIHLNYDFHSSLSALDRETLDQQIKNELNTLQHFLKDCDWLIITYGTAWVHERNDTGDIVANCHKMPARNFSKFLLTQKRILASFSAMMTGLKAFNPSIKILLTVSPVRHLKDTLELNSLSKSVLRVACHTLTQSFDNVEYFPSYEIMMDDLRDYRFYKSDMIHPTGQAEEYIWQKFMEQYMNEPAKKFIEDWSVIRAAIHHKAFHPTSSGHQIFLKQTIEKLSKFKDIVNIDEEMNILGSQIISR